MSRRLGGHHTLPDNPTFLDFPRTDGDENLWPQNTERVVDHEGCVNFMRPMSIDESGTLGWRLTVGAKLAQQMGLEEGPTYILRKFPDGYHMYDHNKGSASNPRHDPYLVGSTNVNRFRSTNEFVPHALWLMRDETMNRANCECKYCAKKPQRVVTDAFGLSASKRSTPSQATPNKVQSVKRLREPRVRQHAKPYAAVRRAPKPSKLPQGPQQSMVPEKDSDIRGAAANKEYATSRWFRKGELVWCAMDPPIRGEAESISFWPGLVEDVNVKTKAIPRSPEPDVDKDNDVDMAQEQAGGAAVGLSAAPRETSQQQDSAESVTTEDTKVRWDVRQWNVYTIKLLAVTHNYYVSDEQVLPYLAYAPTEELVVEVQEELLMVIQDMPAAEMESNLQRSFTFDPCSLEHVGSPEGERLRFRQAVTPYALAVQIASKVVRSWEPTDEWDCKFLIPSLHPPPASTSAPAEPGSASTLHSLITQSMANNATRDLNARPSAQVGLPPEAYGPEGVSAEEFRAISTRLLGNQSVSAPVPQVVNQLRFQGLWWGAERIWTDELVRLKLARCQFAPRGTDFIYPPSGPSASTLEHIASIGHADDTDPRVLGASEKGLFMRLEGLFAVDVPKTEGGFGRECRASGTIYELADVGWEDGSEVAAPAAEGNGKGKERATDVGGAQSISTNQSLDQSGIIGAQDVPGASQGLAGSSFMPGPSPLKPPPLPNPDPSVSIAQTASATITQTVPAGKSKKRTLNGQLSHPVLTTPYPLPPPPNGSVFRPILPPGHEVVLSMSLISGRYYPGLFFHPLMVPAVDKALSLPPEEGGLYENRQLWAMEGLLPGVYQSMDPTVWKQSRLIMLKDADAEARQQLKRIWEEHQREKALLQAQNSAPEASGSHLMDGDVKMN
ncbi:predicted protein [Sparassis crispa]|uniref:Cryptic loci regulator 2 N-terminal domain-containing protein n=1 Tax=Sparassis crispa TaxID=139825 RepID=A0A401GW68_9APHY|nr:predicted protein [Sparassis crispa]GBE86409.1 predicted protein [Sparassis crispa]